MKVFKLTNTFLPSTSIKDFDSLIWSERYQEAGDFKLVVKDDISILTTLPLGSVISHTDTKEVMLVENHEIDRDSDKKLTVTVTGRTLETFAENRPTQGARLPLYDDFTGDLRVETYTASAEAVLYILLTTALYVGYAPTGWEIPNLRVQNAIRVYDSSMAHIIKRGDTYAQVLDLLKLGDVGLKTVRPNGAQTTLDLVIHDGLDKTGTVVFYADNEDLDNAKYFWSIKDYKNYAAIASKLFWRLYRDRDLGSDLDGLEKRIMYVEASDLEGDYSTPTSTDVVASRAQLELNAHKKVRLLQATVSNTARPKFKIHYDIGDLVKVFGEFQTVQTMRVTEHILTVDKAGQRGFPSLSVV